MRKYVRIEKKILFTLVYMMFTCRVLQRKNLDANGIHTCSFVSCTWCFLKRSTWFESGVCMFSIRFTFKNTVWFIIWKYQYLPSAWLVLLPGPRTNALLSLYIPAYIHQATHAAQHIVHMFFNSHNSCSKYRGVWEVCPPPPPPRLTPLITHNVFFYLQETSLNPHAAGG